MDALFCTAGCPVLHRGMPLQWDAYVMDRYLHKRCGAAHGACRGRDSFYTAAWHHLSEDTAHKSMRKNRTGPKQGSPQWKIGQANRARFRTLHGALYGTLIGEDQFLTILGLTGLSSSQGLSKTGPHLYRAPYRAPNRVLNRVLKIGIVKK